MVDSLENIEYPKWHFIGYKHSIWPWINKNIDLKYNTVLDLFGGTGVISHGFRLLGKQVFYNDFLIHLQIIASGLLQSNITHYITDDMINEILTFHQSDTGNHFFQDNFSNTYFFPQEAEFIDRIYSNIHSSSFDPIQKSILFFALTQTCLKKRPFHTFHGSFLNLRLKSRSKPQTWDLDMKTTFRQTINSVNNYLLQLPNKLGVPEISGLMASQAKPEMFTEETIDLLYLDPPFISNKKKRSLRFANYLKNYYVLDLLADYNKAPTLLDLETKKFRKEKYLPSQEMDLWLDQNQKKWLKSFESIIENFETSCIVVSYRSDSLISVSQIHEILSSYKTVQTFQTPHMYENSEKKAKFDDLLFTAK